MDLPRLNPGATLKADPLAQHKLLDVQELDSRIDGIAQKLRTMPEIQQLGGAKVRRGELDDRARDLRIAVDDLTTEQKRADRDVEQVKTRRERDRSRMDQGLISDPKALERMSQELESLERRITTLEDEELEVMEKLEEAQQALDTVTGDVSALDASIAELSSGQGARAAALDAEVVVVRRERAGAVDGLPADLLALYEKLREQKNGVGAALLRARECGGCRLQLDSADLSRIAKAPADEVIRCEECNRILVRTHESGIKGELAAQ